MKKENKVIDSVKRGFTLVELLVVVSILGILATMAVVNFAGATDGANQTTCESSLKAIKQGCILYKTKFNKMPKTMDDLLKEDSDGNSILDCGKEDPWGNEYKLDIKGNKIVVISAGPNGEFGDEDDLRSDKISSKKKPSSAD